jgi:hypothetical protein
MNPLQEEIIKLVKTTDAHTVYYGKKTVNGVETEENALVHVVLEKLPKDQVHSSKLIPKTYTIDGIEHKTDVIQKNPHRLIQCYSSLTDPAIIYLQTRQRPLSGGLEIANMVSFDGQFITTGTLGFIAVDNIDNNLVGVTNNHVIVLDAFLSSEKDPNSTLGSIIDTPTVPYFGTINPAIIQFGSANGSINLGRDTIGAPKRYIPIGQNITNTVDVALIGLNSGNVDSSSDSQAELANTYAMPFASTAELDSMIINNIPIYYVGKRTGPKGPSCQLQVFGHGSTYVSYNKQTIPTQIVMSDVFFVRYPDGSNLPAYSGDSGSAVIGNFNGTYKIVGLLFAADTNTDQTNPTSTEFSFCRIDNIASQLNISAWDGNNLNFGSTTPQNASVIYRPLTDNRPSITYNGKTYWQVGTKLTDLPFTNA